MKLLQILLNREAGRETTTLSFGRPKKQQSGHYLFGNISETLIKGRFV
jgi:hypothetical protein